MFHDIRKIQISHYIWTMSGKPNNEEWTHIKRHPLMGYEIAQKYAMPSEC
jgi:HD-GYP domain-containing protein (c-di-GMP phosphodiesterase class II)